MGKTLSSFQTGNVVVLLFYWEQGYGCAERGRAVQQGREGDLWQAGNDTSLTCRESTRVTVTQSLSDPGFPGSLCSFHAGNMEASRQQEGQSSLRNNVPRPAASRCIFGNIGVFYRLSQGSGKADQGDNSVPAAAAVEPEQVPLGRAGADVFLWSCYAPAPRCSWVHCNPCLQPRYRECLLHCVLF